MLLGIYLKRNMKATDTKKPMSIANKVWVECFNGILGKGGIERERYRNKQ
jgi:hypothetical protein